MSVAALAALMVGCSKPLGVDRAAQNQAKQTAEILSNPTVSVRAQPITYQTLRDTLEITGEVTTSSD